MEPDLAVASVEGAVHGHAVAVTASELVDFDLCWATDLCDPWGNLYELNCYDYDRITTDLIEAHGITPQRYWPRDVFDAYQQT